MSRPEIERARAFLARADADLAAVRALETLDTVPDEIVGFHGQQSAEKLLKAVLVGHGIEFPRTHSLRFLLDCSPTTDSPHPPSSTASPSSTPSGSSSATRRHRSTRSLSTARK
jgi:hypothetical protein